MRLLLFLCFLLFPFSCFAYNIEPYYQQSSKFQNSLNLVFCPLNYQSKEDFLEDIKLLLQRLEKARPFDEFMGSIGVWQVSLTQDEERTLFKETQGFPPLKVRQDFLDDILHRIGSAYKLIIVDARNAASCAEFSSVNKMSLIILGKIQRQP